MQAWTKTIALSSILGGILMGLCSAAQAQPSAQPLNAPQHNLSQRATTMLDASVDLARNYEILREELDWLRSDPGIQMVWRQLKTQYKPELHWSIYAGGVAESTGLMGLSAGAAVDLTAPLCRYIGLEANSNGYYAGDMRLSYDTRATACLPWGPSSIEVGLVAQRDLRVALSATPSLSSSRFSSDGVDFRIRLLGYIASSWEFTFAATDLSLRTYYSPEQDREFAPSSVQLDVAGFRFLRYGKGFLGGDQQIDAISVGFVSETSRVVGITAMARSFAPVDLRGLHLTKSLSLDVKAGVTLGEVGPTRATVNVMSTPFMKGTYFTPTIALHHGDTALQQSLSYERRLVPDTEFRLLFEDRANIQGQWITGEDHRTISAFVAFTRQVGAPPNLEALKPAMSYGAQLGYSRPLNKHLYLQLQLTSARSYYATIDGLRLNSPKLEARGIVSIIASDSSEH